MPRSPSAGPGTACVLLHRVGTFAARACRCALLLAVLAGFGAADHAWASVYEEDAVKAAFLHRFAAYVEWPPSAVGAGPFTIGVMGAEGVVEHLERLLPGLVVQNRPARVKRVASVQDLEGVQILFIGRHSLGRARPVLAAAASRPVLTVTDDEDGLASGVAISFVRVGRNLRFEVSLHAAERSHLKISSGLLAVASRVEGRPQSLLICTEWAAAIVQPSSCGRGLALLGERFLRRARPGRG